nr:MAG TPA_asm: hypothetical protein [Caudoviricetes sp.]
MLKVNIFKKFYIYNILKLLLKVNSFNKINKNVLLNICKIIIKKIRDCEVEA